MTPTEKVLDALERGGFGPRKNGAGWQARCPGHDDRIASLSVSEGGDARALAHCHAGCETTVVLAALGLKVGDLMPPRATERPSAICDAQGKRGARSLFQRPSVSCDAQGKNGAGGFQRDAETRYHICDRAGNLVAIHVRRDGSDGKRFHWERGGKPSLNGLRTTDLPLYGAQSVGEGVVIVVEGEKCCDALVAHGVSAVATVCGAAATPSVEVLNLLAGRDVVLWPDNDEPGRQHMARIAERLRGIAATVRVFRWPHAPEHGDAADFLGAEGGTATDLLAMMPTGDEQVDALAGPSPQGPPTLADVQATFAKWLHMPDPVPLLAVLATIAANRMEGDPLWLLLVGPPSSGKTETLEPLRGLPDVHAAATLTEAALLSGTPAKEKAKDARGGLLRVIGERGVLLCKDFGSVLSMNRDARAGVLAALREVYDGSWTRHVGTDGGRSLSWSGHVGFVGGCPPTLDTFHGVMASLGERFTLLRLEGGSGVERARKALAHAGHETAMRRELTAAVSAFFGSLILPETPGDLSDAERDYIVSLAMLASLCRSAVERDARTREVELVPGAESPARLAVTLRRLHDGLAAIGVEHALRWTIVRRVALDSMPAVRRKVLEAVLRLGEPDTTAVAVAVAYPTTTARRTLEDLSAYGVLARVAGGAGKADKWRIGPALRRELGAFPEMSEGAGGGGPTFPEMLEGAGTERGIDPYIFLVKALEDITGKVPAATSDATPETEPVP